MRLRWAGRGGAYGCCVLFPVWHQKSEAGETRCASGGSVFLRIRVLWSRAGTSDTGNAQDSQAQALVDAVVLVASVAFGDARSNEFSAANVRARHILIDARGYVLTIGYLVIKAE